MLYELAVAHRVRQEGAVARAFFLATRFATPTTKDGKFVYQLSDLEALYPSLSD